MERLRNLVEELLASAETEQRMAVDTSDKNLRWHFGGVALGFRIAAEKIKLVLAEEGGK